VRRKLEKRPFANLTTPKERKKGKSLGARKTEHPGPRRGKEKQKNYRGRTELHRSGSKKETFVEEKMESVKGTS